MKHLAIIYEIQKCNKNIHVYLTVILRLQNIMISHRFHTLNYTHPTSMASQWLY